MICLVREDCSASASDGVSRHVLLTFLLLQTDLFLLVSEVSFLAYVFHHLKGNKNHELVPFEFFVYP